MKKTCGMCAHYKTGDVSFMGEEFGKCLAQVPLLARRWCEYTRRDWPADLCEAFVLEASYSNQAKASGLVEYADQ